MGEKLSRRDFLKLSAFFSGAALFPSSWVSFAPKSVEPQGDVLVVVFLRGAMDGLNVVIPHAESRYYDLRPTLAIPEPKEGDDSTAIDLDGFFSFHPALRPLKDLWDDKALAVIHASGSPDPTHSHFDAQDYMERGTPGKRETVSGWVARHLASVPWTNDSPFRAIGVGGVAPLSIRGEVPVTTLVTIEDFRFQGDTDSRTALSSLYSLGSFLDSVASEAFSAEETIRSLAVETGYVPENGAMYPEGDFGLAMQQVARLVKAEVGMEAACVDMQGWDTHNQEGALTGTLPALLSEFSSALTAFYMDIGSHAKRLTLVAMSEFGRRAYENGTAGTDHGHGNVMFVLGGKVNGGKVYAEWPGLEEENLYGPGDLAVTTDFRDVLAEIVQKRLRNPHVDTVFPDYTPQKTLNVVSED